LSLEGTYSLRAVPGTGMQANQRRLTGHTHAHAHAHTATRSYTYSIAQHNTALHHTQHSTAQHGQRKKETSSRRDTAGQSKPVFLAQLLFTGAVIGTVKRSGRGAGEHGRVRARTSAGQACMVDHEGSESTLLVHSEQEGVESRDHLVVLANGGAPLSQYQGQRQVKVMVTKQST